MTILGRRVRLRAIERSDIPTFVRWLNDPEVTQYLLMYMPMSLAQEERWFEGHLNDSHSHVFGIETEEGKLIGNIGIDHIDWKDRKAELGIVIGEKKVWDRGYGTAATRALVEFAFTTLNLREVRLSCHQDNRRGLRCYQKVGFRTTTAIHEPRVYGDSEVRMTIDRQRWAEIRSRIADRGR